MAYTMQSERELIDGFWYYYLRASGKWHVFVHRSPHMFKLVEDLDTLEEAKQFARTFTENIIKKSNKGTTNEMESDSN